MKIGLSLTSLRADGNPRPLIERARHAHRSGMDSLTVGDKHASPEPYIQNTPWLGRLLAEWPSRRAGCLFLMPLWHPVLMAEQIGTLAALHDGPFIVQTGIGGGGAQFDAMGKSLSTRGTDIDEAIPLVQAMLEGEVVDSERFGIEAGHIGLRPPGDVEWWIGGSAGAAIDRAARVGGSWYAGPATNLERGRAGIERFKAAGGTHAVVRRDVIVTADGDRARSLGAQIIEQGYRGMSIDDVVVGSPSDAAEAFGALSDVGFDEVIVRCMAVPNDVGLETVELLGELNGEMDA